MFEKMNNCTIFALPLLCLFSKREIFLKQIIIFGIFTFLIGCFIFDIKSCLIAFERTNRYSPLVHNYSLCPSNGWSEKPLCKYIFSIQITGMIVTSRIPVTQITVNQVVFKIKILSTTLHFDTFRGLKIVFICKMKVSKK